MTDITFAYIAAGFGAAFTTIGAAFGIGKIAERAMDGIARQPEAGGLYRVYKRVRGNRSR